LRLIFFPLILCAGLGIPGWLLGRALRAPAGATGAFLGSALVLFHVLLGLDALGLPLDFVRVAGGIAVACLILWLATPYLFPPAVEPAPVPGETPATRIHGQAWILLLIGVSLASIAVKAGWEPLSGSDNGFRWDRLARQALRAGRMNFYPPVTDDDFVLYGWCDGIAPLVSDLYLWCYLGAGKAIGYATTPLVIVQGLLLFRVVYQLAARQAGPGAGLAAAMLLGCSPVLLWGVAMGQETGLTALSLAAMLLFLDRHRESGHAGWLVWAGLAAGAGALSREYGLIYVLLGWLALGHAGRFRTGAKTFTLAAAAVTVPWYGRNWIRTGNPLFSHDLAGLFPVNPAHRAVMNCITEVTRYWEQPAMIRILAIALGIMTLVPLALGFFGGIRRWRQTAPWTMAAITIVALWLWSMRQTAGGVIYSLRVLTPALAIAAALGGIVVADLLKIRLWRWLIPLLLVPLSIDASMRALYLPSDHLVAWWRNPPGAWRDFGLSLRETPPPIWQVIAEAAGHDSILVMDPSKQLLLADLGARAMPVFSPVMLVVGDGRRDFSEVLAFLRERHVRFVIMSKDDFIADRFIARARFLRELRSSGSPVAIDSGHVMYDLNSPTLDRPKSPDQPTEPAPLGGIPGGKKIFP
jgi:hypothetical protein